MRWAKIGIQEKARKKYKYPKVMDFIKAQLQNPHPQVVSHSKSTMAPTVKPKSFFLLHLAISLQIFLITSKSIDAAPVPAPWPPQFHAILFMNNSGTLQKVDLWYDWPNGRNFNVIQNQLGKLTYDLGWDNGTSYIYTLDANKECRVLHFSVGILRPNWLDGAEYLGQKYVDKFLCNVWSKVDFIWYYEDVVTKRPVHWVFYTGYTADVITFEVGAVLEDSKWQAPVYCFGNVGDERPLLNSVVADSSSGKLIREVFSTF